MTKKKSRAVKELARDWSEDSAFRAEYEALEEEFALAAALIKARARAGLTQEQVAARMGTSQAYVAKMEGGRINPSVKTLLRFAVATETHLSIAFEPKDRAAGSASPSDRSAA